MNKFEIKRCRNVFAESYSMSNFKIQILNPPARWRAGQCQISNE